MALRCCLRCATDVEETNKKGGMWLDAHIFSNNNMHPSPSNSSSPRTQPTLTQAPRSKLNRASGKRKHSDADQTEQSAQPDEIKDTCTHNDRAHGGFYLSANRRSSGRMQLAAARKNVAPSSFSSYTSIHHSPPLPPSITDLSTPPPLLKTAKITKTCSPHPARARPLKF